MASYGQVRKIAAIINWGTSDECQKFTNNLESGWEKKVLLRASNFDVQQIIRGLEGEDLEALKQAFKFLKIDQKIICKKK